MIRQPPRIALFANRFEPVDNGFLFRADLKSPAVRVTIDERDRFVGDFARDSRLMTWLFTGGLVIITVVYVALAVGAGIDLPSWALALTIIASVLGLMAAFVWQWNAPARALVGRAPAAPGRSTLEARRIALRNLTWRQLGVGALAGPIVLVRMGARHNLLLGWNRVWLVLAGLLMLLVAIQAVRKWRSDAADRSVSAREPRPGR